jgi:uncharacterized membrane protein
VTRRLPYIDWARGLAVLLMIHGHVLDAWTRDADRSTPAFGYLTIMGGFAAPAFLWLAGLSLILAADQKRANGAGRLDITEAVVKRGLEVFVLAFLFRLQAFVISPGGSPLKLFRVDILNIMGLGIVVAGLVWGLARTRRQAFGIYALLAAGAAMGTPVLRTAEWVAWIPTWPSWYIRPMGEHTTFTGFPWWGFVFAGGAAGIAVAWARERSLTSRVMGAFAAAGALLVVLGFYTASLPTIYASSSFWTSSPTYFAIRLGVVVLALAVSYAVSTLALPRGVPLDALARLGQSSLFVYWIHVELVYGTLAAGLRHRLPLWQVEVAYFAFSAAMYAAVVLRDRLVAFWHTFANIGRMPKSI